MKKLLFLTGLITFGILISFSAKAGVADNVSGWAWSNNIGWISFNCTNRGTCAIVDYGVHIDPATGNFSGHAWSENIGWIHFAPAGPYPALPNHSARVDLATGKVSGWARALAHGDGWNGWIKMRGTGYGVSIDTATGEFSGWAWSDMVVGWISFKGANYGVTTTPEAAYQEHNVRGWAWSNNIGWISFNSINCDSDGNGLSDGIPPGCPPTGTIVANYGVNIDSTTGNMTGYAWSANIGWIHFNETAGFPALPNHSARVDLTTGKVSGWARALAHGDGWNGWIKMRGTAGDGSPYGVSIDTTTGKFSGWAWSDMVVGWISFKGANYEVTTTPGLFNQPPSAINLSVTEGNYCGAPAPPIILSWQFSDPDAGDSQSAYQIQVDNQAGFPSPEVDSGKVISSHNEYAPPGLSFNTTYYWRVRVWDTQDAVSAWSVGPSFTTALHRYPTPDFTWSPLHPTVNELIQFTDLSKAYGGATIVSWSWGFGDGTTSIQQNPTHTYAKTGTYLVILEVTDSSGFTCVTSKTLTIGLPLPEWREVPPILRLEKLFARVVDFVNPVRSLFLLD